jgi:hypothetical protein
MLTVDVVELYLFFRIWLIAPLTVPDFSLKQRIILPYLYFDLDGAQNSQLLSVLRGLISVFQRIFLSFK